jgi:hypothetical protein
MASGSYGDWNSTSSVLDNPNIRRLLGDNKVEASVKRVKSKSVKKYRKQERLAITLTEKGKQKLLLVSEQLDKRPSTLASDLIMSAVHRLERKLLKESEKE